LFIWRAAQRFWSDSLTEHMCVDSSKEMNDIAELLSKKGIPTANPIFKGLYFRQFLPASTEVSQSNRIELIKSRYVLFTEKTKTSTFKNRKLS
jgi:hypothetical protein